MSRAKVVAMLLVASSSLGHADDRYGASTSAAIGPVIGPMAWDGPGANEPGDIHLADQYFGGALVLRAVVDRTVTARTALGVGVGAVMTLGTAHLGHTTFFMGGQLEATVRASVRQQPGTMLRFGVGTAIAGFTGGGPAIGANDNVVDLERLAGPVIDASIGWDDAGFSLGTRVAYLVGGNLRYVPVLLIVGFHWGAH